MKRNSLVMTLGSLASLVLVSVLTLTLHIVSQRQDTEARLQQYSRLLTTIVTENLVTKNYAQLRQQLTLLADAAPLPIESILVFDNRQLVVMVGYTDNKSTYLGEETPWVQLADNRWHLIQPINMPDKQTQDPDAETETVLRLTTLPVDINWRFWPLLPLCSFMLLLGGWIAWLQWKKHSLTSELVQLQQNLLLSSHSTPLSIYQNEWVRTLAESFTLVTQRFQHNLQQKEQQLTASGLKQQQSEQQLSDQILQLRQQQQSAESQATACQHSLKQWQHLAVSAQQLSHAQLQFQIKVLDCLRAAEHQTEAEMQEISCPDWLLVATPHWVAVLPESCELLIDDDAQAFQYRLKLDVHLNMLLLILLRQCAIASKSAELKISYRVIDEQEKALLFTLQYEGQNLPASWRQSVSQPALDNLSDQAELQLLKLLLRRMSAVLNIESLDDLGTRLDLKLPVSLQRTNFAKPYQSICVFEPNAEKLAVYKHSLTALGEQVLVVNQLDKLPQELKSRLVDLLILCVPAELELSMLEVDQIAQLAGRYPLVCFTEQAQLNKLQHLPLQVYPQPLLLALVANPNEQHAKIRSQQLLVVDDNQTNLSFVRTVLAGRGVSIDIAMTGAEAIKMATNSRYQLILMDIQLPDLAGTEVTKRIRQLRHHQQTVILAFTAHAMQEEIVRFRLAGMDDVLIKPLDAKKIAHILSRIRPMAES